MRIDTQEVLERACERWQKILRLQDWDIILILATHPEDLSEHSQADCQANIPLKKACIRLAHPDVAPKGWRGEGPPDQEQILVHELLHLHFAAFEPAEQNGLEYNLWEQAVEVLSRVLVGLDRVQAE